MFYFIVSACRKSVYFRKFVNYHCLPSTNMRNIEIKAKVENPEEFLVKVKEISDSKETVIPQRDVFFNLPKDKPGRLKLRNFQVSLYFLINCYFLVDSTLFIY